MSINKNGISDEEQKRNELGEPVMITKTEKKIVKIKLTRKSAEELADLKIKLGLAFKGDREELIKFYMKERECLFG